MAGSKVVDLSARRERWTTAFDTFDMSVAVSNHGRIHILLDGKETYLDMTDAVHMMSAVSAEYERLVDFGK